MTSSDRYIARAESYGWLLFDNESHVVSRTTALEVAELAASGWGVRLVERGAVEGALSAPLKLFINVSNHCNLECSHCFSGSSPKNKTYFPAERLHEVIDEAASMGVFLVIIGGGEPFMRKDLWEIIEHIRSCGMGVSLTTNGTIMSAAMVERIKRFSVRMNVSIDGLEETHDHIRGQRGLFNKVVRTISYLVENDIVPTMRFSLMTSNLHDTPGVLALARNLGVRVKVRRVKPAERAIDNDLIIKDGGPDYYRMIGIMNADPNCNVEDIMNTLDSEKHDVVLGPNDCGAGTRLMFIDADGTISPCSFLGAGFSAGNIATTSLDDVWRTSDKFVAARNIPMNSDCISCRRHNTCHTECPAMRLHVGGSLDAQDPSCLKPYFASLATNPAEG